MVYVTSDIHGYPLPAFRQKLDEAGFTAEDRLYVLGDVVDRNGDGGVEMLLWMMKQPNVELLLGNHEAMLLSCSFLFDEAAGEPDGGFDFRNTALLLQWMSNGCEPTLRSLRRLRKKDPELLRDLLDYLARAPLHASVSACGRKFLLVHSGLGNFDPGRKISDYSPEELLWHRPEAGEQYFPDVMTVLGHTPAGAFFGTRGKMFQTETWIDIDVGAAGGKIPPMLLRLDDLKAFY